MGSMNRRRPLSGSRGGAGGLCACVIQRSGAGASVSNLGAVVTAASCSAADPVPYI